jgi:hypothetical protein
MGDLRRRRQHRATRPRQGRLRTYSVIDLERVTISTRRR